MTDEVQVATDSGAREEFRFGWPALARLIAGCLLTFVLLPYASGRTVVVWLLTGSPEPQYLRFAVAVGIAIVAVTAALSRRLIGSKLGSRVPWIVAAGWIVANIAIMAFSVGPLIPWPQVALAFVPAMLWLPWLVWILYSPRALPKTVPVLVGLGVIAVAIFTYVLKVDGLTGDSKVNFTWRWATPEKPKSTQFAADTDGAQKTGAVDFTKSTPDDYPQYLGPDRTGMIATARISADWKKSPPKVVWRKPVGLGWGAFAVVNGFAVTQEQRDSEECVVCYRIADGAQMWHHGEPVRFVSGMGGDGPRCTPTIANGRVYAIGGTGVLVCLDSTGNSIWRVDVLKDNDAENLYHGVCGSPLVFDNKVVVSPTGGNGLSLAAYDAETGKRLWRNGDKRTSYTSPVLATILGVKQILLHNAHELTGHDPADGRVLWRFPWTNEQHVNCSQPISNAGAADRVFISTGYEGGAALIGVQKSADGVMKTETVWSNRYLKAKFATVVMHQGYLYGLDDGILTCLDLKTGKRKWKGGRYQHGQILLAGNLLIVQAESGDVVLVEPNPDRLMELAKIPALNGKTWNHPALFGRYLLVRNDTEAVCLELPAK